MTSPNISIKNELVMKAKEESTTSRSSTTEAKGLGIYHVMETTIDYGTKLINGVSIIFFEHVDVDVDEKSDNLIPNY